MDEQIGMIHEFDEMVRVEKERSEPTDMFSGWTDEEKIEYIKQIRYQLPEHTNAEPLDEIDVPDSVLFDLSDHEAAQSNHNKSTGHYRSWHYTGSDRRFEFGSKKHRRFVSRSSGTFVYYFRYNEHQVGLVIDGQRTWVEGVITRNLNDGSEAILQFARGDSDDYIISPRTYNLQFNGNYTRGKNITTIKLGYWPLCNSVEAIGRFRPHVSASEPDAEHFEVLILYAAEAGRINSVFYHTNRSLSFNYGIGIVLNLPKDCEYYVLNYKKLSLAALTSLDGKPFIHVKGTPPRNLYQILLAVAILRRQNVHGTCIIMEDAPCVKFHREEPPKGKRRQQLTPEEQRKAELEKGTIFLEQRHGATMIYDSEDWLVSTWDQILVDCEWLFPAQLSSCGPFHIANSNSSEPLHEELGPQASIIMRNGEIDGQRMADKAAVRSNQGLLNHHNIQNKDDFHNPLQKNALRDRNIDVTATTALKDSRCFSLDMEPSIWHVFCSERICDASQDTLNIPGSDHKSGYKQIHSPESDSYQWKRPRTEGTFSVYALSSLEHSDNCTSWKRPRTEGTQAFHRFNEPASKWMTDGDRDSYIKQLQDSAPMTKYISLMNGPRPIPKYDNSEFPALNTSVMTGLTPELQGATGVSRDLLPELLA